MRQKKIKKTAKKKIKAQRYMCPSCKKEMVRTTKEYFCPKCGLTEEIIYTGR